MTSCAPPLQLCLPPSLGLSNTYRMAALSLQACSHVSLPCLCCCMHCVSVGVALAIAIIATQDMTHASLSRQLASCCEEPSVPLSLVCEDAPASLECACTCTQQGRS